MPILRLPGNYNLRVTADVGVGILGRMVMALVGSLHMHISVEAEQPIDVFVIDDSALSDFASGQTFSSLFHCSNTMGLKAAVRIPYGIKKVHIILKNAQSTPTAIFYKTG